MPNINQTECDCMGFYDPSGACLPYDPQIHTEEPCPSGGFWGSVGSWFGGTTQEQWIGGTQFGIQMCQLFGGCGNLGAGSYSDPNSQAYMQYVAEQRRKTNTIIIVGIVIVAVVLFAMLYKKGGKK